MVGRGALRVGGAEAEMKTRLVMCSSTRTTHGGGVRVRAVCVCEPEAGLSSNALKVSQAGLGSATRLCASLWSLQSLGMSQLGGLGAAWHA